MALTSRASLQHVALDRDAQRGPADVDVQAVGVQQPPVPEDNVARAAAELPGHRPRHPAVDARLVRRRWRKVRLAFVAAEDLPVAARPHREATATRLDLG